MARSSKEQAQKDLDRLNYLADRLDSAFTLPGTSIRFGYDSILGLVPGLGDTLTLAPAFYIIWKARELGASTPLTLRMAGNVGIDALVGSIPLIGDLFDVGFKANRRNVALLRRHMERYDQLPHEKGPRHGATLSQSHLSRA
ncbi:DUF4112 domain-containing protein [Gymnodinialimonas sp. 2305UL16-5]|uniref:DUF4112 domain-containing protein n=1 Tax=Gymnodinialimonas mytili TaxID=3126503 RepID=UPI00309A0242